MESLRYQVAFLDRVIAEDFPFIPTSGLSLIKRSIEKRLSVAPLHYGLPLAGNLHGLRRLRVSDYRVIYRVDENLHLVTIEAMGFRKTIYDQ